MAAEFRRDSARPAALWDAQLGDVLHDVIFATVAESDSPVLDIVDVGGGTGGLAVPLATLGHNVTVVDPSPDALAAAQRRAKEVSAPLAAVQGDAASVDGVVGMAAADLIICHNVLEYVDSPADAMAAISRVLRPSGTVSVLASNTVAAVLHRALAGRFAEARRMLADGSAESGTSSDSVQSSGTAGAGNTAGSGRSAHAGVPRRFTLPELVALIEGAGLRVGEAHGLRIFGGLLPGALVDGDPGAAAALQALESAAATYPPLRDIAAQLHVLGHR